MGRMILNGTVYGAGSKVKANPTSTPAGILQTIEIDGVTYSLPQGGGSYIQQFNITESFSSTSTSSASGEVI